MKLTYEQIRSVTTGAVSVAREDDGIHFYRFNQEQLALDQVVCRQGHVSTFERK